MSVGIHTASWRDRCTIGRRTLSYTRERESGRGPLPLRATAVPGTCRALFLLSYHTYRQYMRTQVDPSYTPSREPNLDTLPAVGRSR